MLHIAAPSHWPELNRECRCPNAPARLVLLPLVVALLIATSINASADGGCLDYGTAYGVFEFTDLSCSDLPNDGRGAGDGGGGPNSSGGQLSDLRVYGTHLTLELRQLRLTANTNGEVFQILQTREDGGVNRGGLVALRRSAIRHRGDAPYAITQLQLWMQVPGAYGDEVKISPATYPVYARLDGGEPDQQLQSHGYGPDVTFGLRLSHATVCNIVNYGSTSCGFTLRPAYEVFISRDPLVIDSGESAWGAGYRYNRSETEPVTVSRLTRARHEVRAGPFPDTLGPAKTSNTSDVLDVTLSNHRVYFVGCHNCLEGCDVVSRTQCLPNCPTSHRLASWMWALDNVAPISPGFARSYNGYRVYDNAQPPPAGNPDYCDYTPDRFYYNWGSSDFPVCKGYVENTP